MTSLKRPSPEDCKVTALGITASWDEVGGSGVDVRVKIRCGTRVNRNRPSLPESHILRVRRLLLAENVI